MYSGGQRSQATVTRNEVTYPGMVAAEVHFERLVGRARYRIVRGGDTGGVQVERVAIVDRTIAFDFPAEEHNVIFEAKPSVPANIPITSRRTVYRRFPAAGRFPYDCTLHPGMSGEVEVR